MAKNYASKRSAKSGSFIARGEKIGRYTAIGTARDGTVILEPKLAPKSASKRAIRDAVRAVKARHRSDQDSKSA